MARRNAASDHRPIPVSASGVMFEEKTVPNGVGTGRPPAKFLAPRMVWQLLQLPIAARSRPRLTRAASKAGGPGGSTAAIAGRHTMAKAAAAPPSSTMATMLATIRDGPVMRSLALALRLLQLGCILTQFTRHRSPAIASITADLACREPARPRT